MKNYIYLCVTFLLVVSCKTVKPLNSTTLKKAKNNVIIDLVTIKDDKAQVTFKPIKIAKDTAVFYIPRIVPGTYSSDDYGSFISEFKVFTKDGDTLKVNHSDKNSWQIIGASKIDKITYWVNDTYDIESEHDVFSPAGTNINKDKNFVLNLHGFIGYFKESQENPYSVTVLRPTKLEAATSQPNIISNNPKLIKNKNEAIDNFFFNRYAEVTDTPIMYGKLDNVTFKLNDIEVLLSVYSPNKLHTAKELLPSMKKMMTAQKAFMGNINSTKKYSILVYLSSISPNDAHGFGALEHNNSTVVVLPEAYPTQALEEVMTDVVSHEFFHIITPLTIHSKEIHNFDYYEPKISEHLWMYEGTTEYFAQLFQVKEKMIDQTEFLNRIVTKIQNSYKYDDTMSFTEMSKNILSEPYKANYNNVYEKGTLISMCLDIIIREKSNGEKGILDLMKSLSNKYGANKPFLDEELIDIVTSFTYPEVKDFLTKHVVGKEPINYAEYFQRVGLKYGVKTVAGEFLMYNDEIPYLSANREANQLFFNDSGAYNSFLTKLGVHPNDILVSVNKQKIDLNNAKYLFEIAQLWKTGDKIEMIVNRENKEISLSTTIEKAPTTQQKSLTEIIEAELTPLQIATKKAWLN